MDRTRTAPNQPNRLERTLAHLKIVSRLLGHELHAQNAPRLTFSRDEVAEIQTSIDLFIEDALKNARGTPAALTREVEIPTVEARVN
jgi:ribosome-binding factor A